MRYVFIPLMLVFMLVLGACSGTSVTVDDPIGEGTPQVNNDQPWKPMPADKGISGYTDLVPDNYWNWSMIFDYGDPVEGKDYNYANAELVEVEDGEWWMYFTLTDAAPDGWLFIDAAVNIGDSSKFKPLAGKYPFKWDSEKEEANLLSVVELPLRDWDKKTESWGEWWTFSDDFDIAIHATIGIWGWLGTYDSSGKPINGIVDDETGWGYCGKGAAFPIEWKHDWGNRWGGWTNSTEMIPLFDPFPMKFKGAYPGTYGYWDFEFDTTITPGWSPWPDNDVPGWCTDPRYYYKNWVEPTVYSCYDPELPDYAKSDNWDLISYMLDQRMGHPGSIFATASTGTFQNAVWYFKYGQSSHTPSPGPESESPPPHLAWALIDDATVNGENFVPGAGGWFAAILWPGLGGGYYPGAGLGGSDYPTTYQMNIIAIDP